MSKTRNTIIALTLFCLAAMPVIMAAHFLISSAIIQHDMVEQLEKGIYKTYTLSPQQVQWINPGKELLVDGKMFDVKQYKENGNCIEITGLFDEEENDLCQKYQYLLHEKQGNSSQQLQWLSMFFTPFVISFVSATEKNNIGLIAGNKYRIFSEKTVAAEPSIFTPPPQQITTPEL